MTPDNHSSIIKHISLYVLSIPFQTLTLFVCPRPLICSGQLGAPVRTTRVHARAHLTVVHAYKTEPSTNQLPTLYSLL